MAEEYDFIIVGAGPSGCVTAARTAATAARPRVLLLEAGGDNVGVPHMAGADRFKAAFQGGSAINWGFQTTPQLQLQRQTINYSRGKGLGGSTAINFCAWTVGSRDDYDEWARVVDDPAFGWDEVQRHLKSIENAKLEPPKEYASYIRPREEDHGDSGPVTITYGETEWLPSLKTVLTAIEQKDMGINPDVNSGNPIGMGLGMVCIHNNVRVTASSAYLASRPDNLTTITDAMVDKVIVKGGRATGVRIVDGRQFSAKNAVILSAGAVSTPAILLRSGIGPTEELEKHEIPVVHALPEVGRNLQDHCMSSIGVVIRRENNEPTSGQRPTPMGWFKFKGLDDLAEFRDLSPEWREFLNKPTVPHWELATHTPQHISSGEITFGSDEMYLGASCLIMNTQSTGTVTLQSANPLDDPVIDPAFLSHPFDRRVMIEAMRETMALWEAPVLQQRTLRKCGWPKSNSDEDIWEYVSTYLRSSWHMCGTTRMGHGRETSVVDSSFRVHGLQGLRVVDLSVCPLTPNCHVQTTAYITGEIAAKKLRLEYALDRV